MGSLVKLKEVRAEPHFPPPKEAVFCDLQVELLWGTYFLESGPVTLRKSPATWPREGRTA